MTVVKNFIYGIAKVLFGEKEIGWIEKDSFEWGGTPPESVDINAEQVPDAPVLNIPQSNGTIAPTFNLVQLNYENLAALMGGTLVGTEDNYTGWEAPTDLVQLSGKWKILTRVGKTILIPNGTVKSNLDGKLALSEVSKVKCELKVVKPEDGTTPLKIYNMTDEESALLNGTSGTDTGTDTGTDGTSGN